MQPEVAHDGPRLIRRNAERPRKFNRPRPQRDLPAANREVNNLILIQPGFDLRRRHAHADVIPPANLKKQVLACLVLGRIQVVHAGKPATEPPHPPRIKLQNESSTGNVSPQKKSLPSDLSASSESS